jgi:hypothetical protein
MNITNLLYYLLKIKKLKILLIKVSNNKTKQKKYFKK